MNTHVFLAKPMLFIFLLVISLDVFAQIRKVVVYYQWYEYINGNAGPQLPWQLQYQYMTHIIHIGGGGATDANTTPPYYGILNNPNGNDSARFFWQNGKNMVDSLVNRAHANNVKVLICLGSAGDMSAVENDSVKTQTMCNAVVDFAKRNNYDGVDVDWESSTRTDATLSRIFRMLRRRMTTTWGGYRTRGLLCSSPATAEFFTIHPDSMDWVQPQMYDMNRTWNEGGQAWTTEYGGTANGERFGFNGAIRTPASATQGMNQYRWQINWEGIWPGYGDTTTIRFGPRYYVARGWDTSKVLVGFSPTGYGTDLVPNPRYGGYTWWGNSFNGRGGKVTTSWWRAALAAGATRNFDARSGTAWLGGTLSSNVPATIYNGLGVNTGHIFCAVGEDTTTTKLKSDWIKANHLGGIMYYDIGGGYDPGYINGVQQPLLYIMYRELNNMPIPRSARGHR
jgi:hypothetical protein